MPEEEKALTLEDLIIAYETEFVTRLKRYSIEDFSEFIDNHIEKCKKLLKGTKDELKMLDGKTEAEEKIGEETKRFYDMILKDRELEKKVYKDWRQLFVDKFKTRENLMDAMDPIIEAQYGLIQFMGEKVDKYKIFIKTCEKIREEMSYLCFPFNPLTERYIIKGRLFVKSTEGTYKTFEVGELNNELKHTIILGRNPPKDSIFHKYKTLMDLTVSKEQGIIGFNKDGYLVYKQKGKNYSRIEDYEGIIRKVLQDNSQILVPRHFDEDKIIVTIYFGGEQRDNYKLQIAFERKIKVGQLKK